MKAAGQDDMTRLMAVMTTADIVSETPGAASSRGGVLPITMSIMSLPGTFPVNGGPPVRHS